MHTLKYRAADNYHRPQSLAQQEMGPYTHSGLWVWAQN